MGDGLFLIRNWKDAGIEVLVCTCVASIYNFVVGATFYAVFALYVRGALAISWRCGNLARMLEELLDEDSGTNIEAFVHAYLVERSALRRFNSTLTYAVAQVCAVWAVGAAVCVQRLVLMDWTTPYGRELVKQLSFIILLALIHVVIFLYVGCRASATGDSVYDTSREVCIALTLQNGDSSALQYLQAYADDGALQISVLGCPLRFRSAGPLVYALFSGICLYLAHKMHLDIEVFE